ncbi:sigma-70 family RNA polymerase sigma factor [Methylobacterium komagatae]
MLLDSGLDEVRPKRRIAAKRAMLPLSVRQQLGFQLQAAYQALVPLDPPDHFLGLIANLDVVLTAKADACSAAFRDGLMAAVPALQTYAQSLVGNASRADDLVQEALLKAWANQDRFVPGTKLKAWLFTILRNQFYSECRRARREVEDIDGVIAGQIATPAPQEHGSDLQVVLSRMAQLPAAQREALLLVGAQGMTYEAAAEVLGCQTGTVKSRVSRARAYLCQHLAPSSMPTSP